MDFFDSLFGLCWQHSLLGAGLVQGCVNQAVEVILLAFLPVESVN